MCANTRPQRDIAAMRRRRYDAPSQGGVITDYRSSHQREIRSIVRCAAFVSLVTLNMLGCVVVLSACSAKATASHVSSPNPRPSEPGVIFAKAKDWFHDLQVIANLKARSPAMPVVLLLGGSSARECTISDATWAAQVRALGRKARTYDLGSSQRTFAEDVALIRALPFNQLDGLVFIGVNPGIFARPETSASITLPAPTFPLPPWPQHIVGQAHIKTLQQKRALVSRWLTKVRPLFRANYGSQEMLLERLITACRSRHLHVVLLEMPEDMAVIGHAMDGPIFRVRRTCRALSARYSIPFVGSFVRSAGLPTVDFYDTYHLVEPGRVKWQRLLSRETARQLRSYGLAAPGVPR